MVMKVAGRLSGGVGPGGVDSMSLQNWLLQFGATSGELRIMVADFTEWLVNGRHPCAAYCALIFGQLIALNKQLGVRPVMVGETWRRVIVKCILRVMGQ